MTSLVSVIVDGGGELTHYMTGNENKLKDGRPSTEPMFSRGEFADFPGLKKYTKTNYIDFIHFYTHNNEQTLIWQSVHNKYISSVFDNHKKYNNKKKQFWVNASIKEVKEQMKIHSKAGLNIFSLAVDQKCGKFYTYMQEGYGTAQSIVQTEDPEDLYMPGLSVTSVACLNKTYFFVVTAGVSEFENREQVIFTCRTRSDLDNEIKRHRANGRIITSFCVNSDLKEYLVVMTEMEGRGQESKWFNDRTTHGAQERDKWTDDLYQRRELLYTIACDDPSDYHTFYVTTEDADRSGHQLKFAPFFD